MKYFELVVTVSLQEDVPFLSSYEFISNMISRAMLNHKELKELHGANKFKLYTFCAFHPIESDKIYRKGRLYITNIRSLSVEIILALKKVLPHVSYPIMILATDIRMHQYRPITEMATITPVIATVDNRCWTREDGLILLRNRAHINALKKYRNFFGDVEEPDMNFIEYIRQINKKPIKIPYKNTSLLGNKLVIGIKCDEISQKLAFTALGAGLLEKGSLGFGYCLAR
ncbi:MAG: CRISPR-associated protein Cas6 [Clostridiales bacterium]|nr:CRISPR-associated protein Cas6 [Clostridiales bacterium]